MTKGRRIEVPREVARELVGRSPEQLQRMLGRPSDRLGDAEPVPNEDWTWTVGIANEGESGSDADLFVEVERGRAVYAEAPGGEPDGSHTTSGTPAGR